MRAALPVGGGRVPVLALRRVRPGGKHHDGPQLLGLHPRQVPDDHAEGVEHGALLPRHLLLPGGEPDAAERHAQRHLVKGGPRPCRAAGAQGGTPVAHPALLEVVAATQQHGRERGHQRNVLRERAARGAAPVHRGLRQFRPDRARTEAGEARAGRDATNRGARLQEEQTVQAVDRAVQARRHVPRRDGDGPRQRERGCGGGAAARLRGVWKQGVFRRVPLHVLRPRAPRRGAGARVAQRHDGFLHAVLDPGAPGVHWSHRRFGQEDSEEGGGGGEAEERLQRLRPRHDGHGHAGHDGPGRHGHAGSDSPWGGAAAAGRLPGAHAAGHAGHDANPRRADDDDPWHGRHGRCASSPAGLQAGGRGHHQRPAEGPRTERQEGHGGASHDGGAQDARGHRQGHRAPSRLRRPVRRETSQPQDYGAGRRRADGLEPGGRLAVQPRPAVRGRKVAGVRQAERPAERSRVEAHFRGYQEKRDGGLGEVLERR
mmetsp:Transcript_85597/g.242377  ORF Transcript_85597/g.242377 Transcript_85597/m.242377 type:complete len:486 (+) Transcript_85597:4196-5653(+)